MAFGLKPDPLGAGGDRVSRLSDEKLGRIELVDHEQALQVGSTLQLGTMLVITDFAASPDTRTAPDFVVVTADPEESK